jgi:hypothetical protein
MAGAVTMVSADIRTVAGVDIVSSVHLEVSLTPNAISGS